jgi:hypothetical protein
MTSQEQTQARFAYHRGHALNYLSQIAELLEKHPGAAQGAANLNDVTEMHDLSKEPLKILDRLCINEEETFAAIDQVMQARRGEYT